MSYVEKPHILIVDDDERIRTLLYRYLKENDFVVASAADGQEALDMLDQLAFDAVIADVMMPVMDGHTLTREIQTRFSGRLPVLMLTALGESNERIEGLETGADDYLTKPFEPKELLLRLKAILRRTEPMHKTGQAIRLGGWMFEPSHNILQKDGEDCALSQTETALLQAFLKTPNAVLSRDRLAELTHQTGQERSIDVQITRLRKKLEDNPKSPRILITVRGQGYQLRVERNA